MTQTLHPSDHELKTSIAKELAWAPNVTADHVGVALNDGAVTLSGEVASYPEKAAAVQAALRIRGVVGVADELVVKSTLGLRRDVDIARDAGTALSASVRFPAGSVQATVHDHRVSLSGTVAWNHQREAAAHLVAGLPGVSGVLNGIALKPALPFAAEDAKVEIRRALVRHAQLDAASIVVGCSGTEIEMTGTVSSWAESREAELAAWATPGVTHVKNQLTVVS